MPRKRKPDDDDLKLGGQDARHLRNVDIEDEAENSEELMRREGRIKK